MAADLTVNRVGYGTMQVAGPRVFGPPADRDAAVAVRREAIVLGSAHIAMTPATSTKRITA